jgi:uncharacterized protein with HEPN domain
MSKMEKLRRLFKNGAIATQHEFANMLGVRDYHVRSYISCLRAKGWAIINYPIPGSNKTKYGLVEETSHPKEGVNKTFWTLPLEKGKFVYTKV